MSNSNTSVLALVGLQWGDEGKGKLIDWVAADARHVARFQGGHNAGHTVIADDLELVLHLIPSGILRPDCRCYIGQGVVLSISALLEEIATLQEAGIDCTGRLFVDPRCSLVMPHHIALDKARETTAASKGTTLRGIGPAHEDKTGRTAVRLGEVLAGEHSAKLAVSVARANAQLEQMHEQPKLDANEIGAGISELAAKLEPYVSEVAPMLVAAKAKGERILLEGSQGALLDIEQGTYPFVTSASCTAAACAPGLGVDLKPKVIGIAKAYATRVGTGTLPTLFEDNDAQTLITQGKEFGATTSRQRRVGWIDIPALKHALAVNGCDEIALTKIDILSHLEKIKICTSYSLDGKQLEHFPSDNATLERCKPEYIEMPSWEDIKEAKSFAELPVNCQNYITKLEELAGVSVTIISNGPERTATFRRKSS